MVLSLTQSRQPRPPKVFISYSQKDRQFVERLAGDLKKLNLGVWVDFVEIKIGDSLLERIEEGLQTVDYVIAVLSQNSISSKWVKKEINVALTRALSGTGAAILPVKIDDCEVPTALTDLVYGDFRSYQDGLRALLARLYPGAELRVRAEEIVRGYTARGHILPTFFAPNAIAAIERRLVPLVDLNYHILFWGGMEYWFERNLETGATTLTKWEQLDFFLDFAKGRYQESEVGTYSIPWHFLGQEFRQAFDWKQLSMEDPLVRRHALAALGVCASDVRFTHQSAIDFLIAVQFAVHFDCLRTELADRLPRELLGKISARAEEDFRYRALRNGPLRSFLDLSRLDTEQLYGSLPHKNTTYWSGEYFGANLISLMRAMADDLKTRDFRDRDLRHADFAAADVRGCDFSGAFLGGANFSGASLDGARITLADFPDIKGVQPSGYQSLAFAPNGLKLAAGTTDGVVVQIDVANGNTTKIWTGQQGYVSEIAWEPNGAAFLSASGDGTIRRIESDSPNTTRSIRSLSGRCSPGRSRSFGT